VDLLRPLSLDRGATIEGSLLQAVGRARLFSLFLPEPTSHYGRTTVRLSWANRRRRRRRRWQRFSLRLVFQLIHVASPASQFSSLTDRRDGREWMGSDPLPSPFFSRNWSDTTINSGEGSDRIGQNEWDLDQSRSSS